MKRFDPLCCPIATGVALALAFGACSTAQKPPTRDTAVKAAPDPAAAPPVAGKQADAPTGRSLRLFDDAVRAFSEQKQSHAFDWPLLERKFQAVIDADDRFAEAWFDLGIVYEHERRLDDAKKAYRKALDKKPSLKQAAENLAVIAENEGKPGDALAIYQDILQQFPDDGAARARMASLYRESGDFDRALRFAREALMREPQNLTAYKVMMRAYLERNDLNMARLVALRATKLAQDPELTFVRGLIAQKEGDEQGAVLLYRQAMRERDDYLAARIALAEIATRHRDWASAGDQYRKIIQYEPGNVAARVNLGLAYKGLGQIDKAMAEYDAAIKADSKLPQPYFFMGVIFQKNKDAPEKALEYYRKFIDASGGALAANHPVFENIRECEQYLQQLREAKATEERARMEKEAAEERTRREADEKKRSEEQKKRDEAHKAKAAQDGVTKKPEPDKEGSEPGDAASRTGEGPVKSGAQEKGVSKSGTGAQKPEGALKPAPANSTPSPTAAPDPKARPQRKPDGRKEAKVPPAGSRTVAEEPKDDL